MKLLSITVPCYNSAEYMDRCIESLLVGGEDVEIILVDDGSKDDTGKIADAYAEKYPSIIKVVHKENGGHGSGVNVGMEKATGVFFKVVDSDDWLAEGPYKEILGVLKQLVGGKHTVDMLIANFVYEKVGEKRKRVISFHNTLPQNQIFGWDEIGHFKITQYILMHSVIYRTELLRECGLKLPEHTFYVDNLFIFNPLPYVRTMYYVNTNFYRYYIGREDQSVNEEVMIKRVDQQIRVNKMMVDYITSEKITNRKTYNYMLKYLDTVTAVSCVILMRAGTPEALRKRDELWNYIKKKDKKVFNRLRHGLMGRTMNLPGKGGRKVSELLYIIARKVMKFN